MRYFPPRARSSYSPMKVTENMRVKRTEELPMPKSEPISNLSRSFPESGEKGSFIIRVRCPGCGNTLAYINLDEYEGPMWKRFSCKNCGNTLPVSINPAIVEHA